LLQVVAVDARVGHEIEHAEPWRQRLAEEERAHADLDQLVGGEAASAGAHGAAYCPRGPDWRL
jgi:hypothetical protein